MMAAGTFVSSEDEAKDKVSKMKSMILDKMLDAIPSFAKAVFRFFGEQKDYFFDFSLGHLFAVSEHTVFFLADVDGSGTISKEEILLCARMAKTMFEMGRGRGGQKPNLIIAGRQILESVFRIFDEDKDGKIQTTELASIFGSWINTIFTLIAEVLDLTEELIFDDAVKTAALQVGMNLEILPKDSNGNIIIEDALKSLFSDMPDRASSQVASQVNQTTQMVKDQARSYAPDIDTRFTAATAMYDGLLSRLDSMAINGELSKDRCVEVMTPVFCDMVENFLSLEVVSQAKAEPLSMMDSAVKSMTPIKSGIPINLCDDLINTVVVSLRSFFRGGGLKQFVQTFFDLLDVNNDGVMSKEEIKNLGDATSLLFQVRWPRLH
jgi:Ca2+-binding EF-hand superfamily protein